MSAREPLTPGMLRRQCDPQQFSFDSTLELAVPSTPLGQARAVEALKLATAIGRDGYNAYVAGQPGTGKERLVRQVLSAAAAAMPVPSDWVYVHNFANHSRPRALELPPGRADELRKAAAAFTEGLRAMLPAAFEAEDYRSQHRALEKQLEEQKEKRFIELREAAEKLGVTLARSPTGFVLAPMKDDKVLSPDEFRALPAEEHARLHAELERQEEKLRDVVESLPALDREHVKKVNELDRAVAGRVVAALTREPRQAFAGLPKVLEYLDAVQKDIVENIGQLIEEPDDGPLKKLLASSPPWERYEVNVLVDRRTQKAGPLVLEDLPTHPRLLGRVDHRQLLGALVTDFTMIRSGALHQANGGFLVLDARRLLNQPFAWDSLKRALRSKQVDITTVADLLGIQSSASLEPEPIPLKVRVVLMGERYVYYLLAEYDPEFLEHFKVLADFEEDVDRSRESEHAYAQLAASLCREESLLPLDREGAARFVEYGGRLASDQAKLSLRTGALADLLREADHQARQSGRERISGRDVQRAVDDKIHRSDRMRARIQEAIKRGTLLIDPRGSEVGQVHGLTVAQLADFEFGWPVRITARARLGKGQVMDIERETELGGPLHSKGVMILSNFLASRYAHEVPFSMSASLVFEQSYGPVEGDSASAAELFALVSALADVPLTQSLAVTGSVNQHGVIQPIGAVNEKIEGYFDVCKERGLTGEEGVIIPAPNVKHLMLRDDVVQAVSEGKFRVYAIETIDQGLELLSGKPAGARDAKGAFPKGSLNQLVEARLLSYAEHAKHFARR